MNKYQQQKDEESSMNTLKCPRVLVKGPECRTTQRAGGGGNRVGMSLQDNEWPGKSRKKIFISGLAIQIRRPPRMRFHRGVTKFLASARRRRAMPLEFRPATERIMRDRILETSPSFYGQHSPRFSTRVYTYAPFSTFSALRSLFPSYV